MGEKRRAALPSNLRRKNYLSILNIFRTGKALSANDISYQTGISRATVMKAINSFISKGLVESAGKGDSTEIGGKKPELFRFCMNRYLLCIGLWSTEMVVALYDLTNTLIAQKTANYNMKDDVHTFLDTIQRAAENLLNEVNSESELLYGVSLCLGGYLDEETGVLQYSILTPEWGKKVPLRQLLSERFPNAEITVDNVARMSACAAVLDNPEYLDRKPEEDLAAYRGWFQTFEEEKQYIDILHPAFYSEETELFCNSVLTGNQTAKTRDAEQRVINSRVLEEYCERMDIKLLKYTEAVPQGDTTMEAVKYF